MMPAEKGTGRKPPRRKSPARKSQAEVPEEQIAASDEPTQVLPPVYQTAGAAVPPAAGVAPAPTGPAAPPPAKISGLSKGAVIAIVAGSVAALGAVGGITWMLASKGKTPEVAEPEAPVQPGVLTPSPVPTTPAPPVTPTTPTSPQPPESPTSPSSPSPPPVNGETVSVGGGAVTFALPSNWAILGQSETNVLLVDENASYIRVELSQLGPGTDASVDLTDLANFMFQADFGYSQMLLGEVQSLTPGGSVTSFAGLGWEGLYTSSQGSYEVEGALYSAVRADGLGLGLLVETPLGSYDAQRASWEPIQEQIINSFADVS